ncbi:lytic murein transglycosylase, partial [Saccharothrix sp.]|uniref:lytic transglycosylase domain-containing protein n=1 Tax=Saccharothrix sp. TaxID=1873460 RepID=UPI0028126E0F
MAVPKRRRGRKRKALRQATLTPRQWGLAATATCAMLAPVLLHTTSAVDWVNVSGSSDIEAVPPGLGDVLGSMSDSSALGVNGRLPEADELSAALLAEAADPSDFLDDLGPFDGLDGETVAGKLGIPGVMLDAYMKAANRLAATTPGCNLHWSLLAGIGRIESGHARGGRVDAAGTTVHPILGPVLNGGPGMAAIRDTDGGRYDQDTTWDRAVGPMQFIPSTWAAYAADGNGDGETNPNNVFDATVGAGNYLCAGGANLNDPQQRARAVFRYNHSEEYVRTVLYWADAYADGVTPLPGLIGSDDDYAPVTSPGSQLPGNPGQPGQPSQPSQPGQPGTTNPPSSSNPSTTTPSTSPTTITLVPTPSCPTTTTPTSTSPTTPTSTTPSAPGCTTTTTPSTTPSTTQSTTSESSAPQTSSSQTSSSQTSSSQTSSSQTSSSQTSS